MDGKVNSKGFFFLFKQSTVFWQKYEQVQYQHEFELLIEVINALQDIANKWADVKHLVPKRDGTLQNEMMKQQNNMRLRKQFAAKANVVGPWIENQLDAVASMGIQTKSSLEEQLKKLRQYEQATAQYKPNIDELERYNQVL